MPSRTSLSGGELFIVDNSDVDWKVLRYLHDWSQIAKGPDIATAYLEIGSLLAMDDEWQKIDQIRILMGDKVSKRTKTAFQNIRCRLDASLELAKEKNDFLVGVPAIVEAIRAGKIQCRVYRKEKFHAKAYISHGRLEVVGPAALVGSSNFTCDGVGLGKTFVGLMLIERLILHDRKRVVLLVPKAARADVWETHLQRYLPDRIMFTLS